MESDYIILHKVLVGSLHVDLGIDLGFWTHVNFTLTKNLVCPH